MRSNWVFTASVATALLSLNAHARVLYEATFEEASSLGAPTFQAPEANPGRIVRSTEQARVGAYSVKVMLTKGEPLVSGSQRNEMKPAEGSISPTAERWMGVSIFLPSNYVSDPVPESLFQWHNSPNFKAGETWSRYKFQNPYRMETNNGRWVFVHQFSSVPSDTNSPVRSKAYDLGAYETGKWTDFVVHFKLTWENSGIIEIWKNGQKVMDFRGPSYYRDESGPYMKMGIYKWGWAMQGVVSTSTSRTVYFDEFTIGDENSSYAEVAPRGAVAPAPAPSPSPTATVKPSPTATPAPSPSSVPVGNVVAAVNCGGPSFRASNGITYEADRYFSGGATYSIPASVANTNDDALFHDERSGKFGYAIPVANGIYDVVLGFNELYFTSSGQRRFDILLEGSEVVSNLDLVATTGGKNRSYTVTKSVTVRDGVLNIGSNSDINNAQLSAFHVVRTGSIAAPSPSPSPKPSPSPSPTVKPSPSPTPSPTVPAGTVVAAINCGGPSVRASSGITYQADRYFSGGSAYSIPASVANTTDDALYHDERSGRFSYAIPLPNGTYEVALGFNELYFTRSGQRRFDILLEGVEVVSNLDLVAMTGGKNRAYYVIKTVTVRDGVLNIGSNSDINNAQLSAFHVIKR